MRTTTMKTVKLLIVFTIIAVFFLSSCDNPIGLDKKLDLDGPVVEFTSPVARKAVSNEFMIKGTATDQSGVETLLLTAEWLTEDSRKEPVAQQWRYTKGVWEISEDFGKTWRLLEGAAWEGSVYDAIWSIPIDMSATPDGEYLFMVTAEDVGGQSDDNSFKTRVLIIDKTPPVVQVFDPYVYFDYRNSYDSATNVFSHDPLQELHALTEADDPKIGRRNYINIGKFLTRGFDMKWEIIDQYDIWSVDILFCDLDAQVDGLPETQIAGDKIYYRYHENLPPPPVVPQPANNVKPNGTARVPDLKNAKGAYEGTDGEIIKPVTEKTTIRVVAVCYDAAGNPNNEKTIGYFVFWPKADEPWIDYADGMNDPAGYYDRPITEFAQQVAMFYPGRSIKANAFQAHGVRRVTYEVYQCIESKDGDDIILTKENLEKRDESGSFNTPRGLNIFSTNFPWEFTPPIKPGFYVVKAKVWGSEPEYGDEEFSALFQIQDVSFPDFPEPPLPPASEPLYMAIDENDNITIKGLVSDATGVISLLMVWINPDSENYATMSQLQYFRDPNYPGWAQASDLTPGGTSGVESEDLGRFPDYPDYPYDKKGNKKYNKLWNLVLSAPTEDPVTKRQLYTYSQTISMENDLGIGIGKADLRSQMFLLRAENQGGKTAIITYAPQGDALPPKVEITTVVPNNGEPIKNGDIFKQIPKFDAASTTVVINGTWDEDSTRKLKSDTYFYDSFRFSINGVVFDGKGNKYEKINSAESNGTVPNNQISVAFTPNPDDEAITGTFAITVTVASGNALEPTDLRDTLAVNVSVRDYGGNPSEAGASWLIESDNLQFVRVSSDDDDHAYKQGGDPIRIFVEFNKPVVWVRNPSTSPTNIPYLMLNSGGVAKYDTNQTSENTKHYFIYNVGSTDNTAAGTYLNVNGISIDGGNNALGTGDDTQWKNNGYNFTFLHTAVGGETYEEIRLTTNTTHTEVFSRNPDSTLSTATKKVYARMLPVTENLNDADYMRTLGGGKRIIIDNTPPEITGITATPAGWHTKDTDIYITATFDEAVAIGSGANIPYLILNTGGTGNNVRTSTTPADIRVSGTQITFKYTVKPGDNAATANGLQVTGFGGDILDIPGNRMSTLSAAATSATLGVYLDTTAPAVPAVAVFSGTIASPGTQIPSPVPAILYHDNVFIRVAASTGSTAGDNINLGRIEYSLNGGADWASSTNASIDVQLGNGSFTIRARQIDRAGNESDPSADIIFTRDPGTLITRISSSAANGTYTHTSGRNLIPITVYFRKPVSITAASGITLNAIRGGAGGTPITVTTFPATEPLPRNNVTSLTFNYTVQNETTAGNGDRMPTPVPPATDVWLDVDGIGTITATDAAGINVNSFFTLPASGSSLLLRENKQIKVITGNLTRSSIAFKTANASGVPTLDAYDTAQGWVTNNEASAKYQGIRSDDGSYWTTLEIAFNHNINKGSGDITIEQIAGSGNTAYRLPAVLTEAQYNRFRNVSVTVGGNVYNFDTYYTKGTNGYIYNSDSDHRSDTSAKYVLNYNNNPNSGRGGTAVFTGDVLPATDFFNAFRTAERITLNVNSQAVEINGSTLKVRLTGSNAPQVPGATYTIKYPAGLVIDELGNSSQDSNNQNNTNMTGTGANQVVGVNTALGGVAKPIVRIKKTQDTITRQAGTTATSLTTPALTAIQPLYAYVRMDSRTPNSSIVYWTDTKDYTASSSNWNGSNNANPGPVNPNTPAAARPDITGTSTTYTPQPAPVTTNQYGIRIGADTYGGHKWWVVARTTATVDGTAYTSAYSDEMAYRTAITYRLRGMRLLDTTGQQLITTTGNPNLGGRQIWIRGGDSLGSSSIPGFPFTWEDNWSNLNTTKKRAGIRLMTKTNNTDQLTDSTWQFMTWDINATAYIDFLLGLDDTQTVNDFNFTPSGSPEEVWQYGPKYWALQRAGWAPSKSLYPVYPGEIRYLDTGTNFPGAGDVAPAPQMNFSAAFNTRGAQTVNYPNANTNN